MGSQKQKKRPLRRRQKLTLAATGLVVVISLLITGLHAVFPSFPGWDELFVVAGLRENPSETSAERTPGFLFVDVGQGDCTLVLGERVSVMIDAGPSRGVHRVTEALDSYGIERLDALILTHAHEDHIGGAAALLKAWPVDAVYLPEGDPQGNTDRESYDGLLGAVQEQEIELVRLSESTELQMEELTLSIYLSPLESSDENENGLMVRAALPDLSALITGDAGTDTEFALMKRGDWLESDILKVGHHGSKTSTSLAFLRRVAPKAAVISVGENTYGHPSEVVTSRLSTVGIPYYRTDISGNIFFDNLDAMLSSDAA